MKYHKMQIEHDPSHGQFGDCFRSCLASVLDYDDPLAVPHFFNFGAEGESEDRINAVWDDVDTWLKGQHNLQHISIPWEFDSLEELLKYTADIFRGAVFMLVGASPNANHVVICRDGKVIHDPNPASESPYLLGPAKDGYWWTEFLVHSISVDSVVLGGGQG